MSLTDEDKQWFGTQLGRIETRFLTELGTVETRLLTELERVETKFLAEVQRLDQKIERVETNLLTEFHKWASPFENRQRSHAAAIRALDLEMEALDGRVQKLEG